MAPLHSFHYALTHEVGGNEIKTSGCSTIIFAHDFFFLSLLQIPDPELDPSRPTSRNLRALSPRPKLMRGLSRVLRVRSTMFPRATVADRTANTTQSTNRPGSMLPFGSPPHVGFLSSSLTVLLLIEWPPVDVAYGTCILRPFPYFEFLPPVQTPPPMVNLSRGGKGADIIVVFAVRRKFFSAKVHK